MGLCKNYQQSLGSCNKSNPVEIPIVNEVLVNEKCPDTLKRYALKTNPDILKQALANSNGDSNSDVIIEDKFSSLVAKLYESRDLAMKSIENCDIVFPAKFQRISDKFSQLFETSKNKCHNLLPLGVLEKHFDISVEGVRSSAPPKESESQQLLRAFDDIDNGYIDSQFQMVRFIENESKYQNQIDAPPNKSRHLQMALSKSPVEITSEAITEMTPMKTEPPINMPQSPQPNTSRHFQMEELSSSTPFSMKKTNKETKSVAELMKVTPVKTAPSKKLTNESRKLPTPVKEATKVTPIKSRPSKLAKSTATTPIKSSPLAKAFERQKQLARHSDETLSFFGLNSIDDLFVDDDFNTAFNNESCRDKTEPQNCRDYSDMFADESTFEKIVFSPISSQATTKNAKRLVPPQCPKISDFDSPMNDIIPASQFDVGFINRTSNRKENADEIIPASQYEVARKFNKRNHSRETVGPKSPEIAVQRLPEFVVQKAPEIAVQKSPEIAHEILSSKEMSDMFADDSIFQEIDIETISSDTAEPRTESQVPANSNLDTQLTISQILSIVNEGSAQSQSLTGSQNSLKENRANCDGNLSEDVIMPSQAYITASSYGSKRLLMKSISPPTKKLKIDVAVSSPARLGNAMLSCRSNVGSAEQKQNSRSIDPNWFASGTEDTLKNAITAESTKSNTQMRTSDMFEESKAMSPSRESSGHGVEATSPSIVSSRKVNLSRLFRSNSNLLSNTLKPITNVGNKVNDRNEKWLANAESSLKLKGIVKPNEGQMLKETTSGKLPAFIYFVVVEHSFIANAILVHTIKTSILLSRF